jgi:hypothetical protein
MEVTIVTESPVLLACRAFSAGEKQINVGAITLA